MGTPHKYAELIKAWADGAEIQWKRLEPFGWIDCANNKPVWDNNAEYRIKPKTIKYRVGLFEFNGKDWTQVYSNEGAEIASEKHSVTFKRWLTDWQEVEV